MTGGKGSTTQVAETEKRHRIVPGSIADTEAPPGNWDDA